MTGSASKSLLGGNPYVGPRPFEPGETLYGREAEINELYYLWKAERIVLLHSPSGAGKSSLLQAGLLPRIETSFDVWGPTRVNQRPPVAMAAEVNRYALSAMLGFEEGVPERLRRGPRELAGLRLAEYVEKRPRRRRKASKSVALLFDQFEEILTVDPLAEDAKREFFDQLGELLRNPRVWALFVLREDYLAPLHPFLRQVPTHLKNRFRIDLLSLDGAREAMVRPALAGGRDFPAADQLLRDLATMKVQQPDGSFVEQTGRYVEPVQLQVVCYRLWDAMPAGDRSIDPENLAQFGDVTEALSGYYADSVRRVAGDPAEERAIRDWFGERLITAGGIRGQVLRGADESEGLANGLIERLLDTHLVRAEQRAGATWYELAHDRLIEPVRSDNAAWRAEHLSEFQQRATLWEHQGRPPALLIKDDELLAAERWSVGSVVITELELLFLKESKKAQEIVDRERRQARRIKRLGVAATIVAVLALLAGAFAVVQMVEAQRQRREAISQREEAESQRQRAEQEKAAADRARQEAVSQRLMAEEQQRIAQDNQREAEAQRAAAVEAGRKARRAQQSAEAARDDARAAQKTAEEQQRIAEEQRRRAEEETQRADDNARTSTRLRLISEAEALAARTTSMTEASLHELAALLALGAYRLNQRFEGEAESSQIYNALRLALRQLGADRNRVLHGHKTAVRSLAVSSDGRTLASGGEDGEVRVVDLDRPADSARVIGRFNAGVRALAWGGGGLAAGSFAGDVRLWDAGGLEASPRVVHESPAAVYALAFEPGGESRLAIGDAAGNVVLRDPGAARGDGDVLWRGAESEAEAPGTEAGTPQIRSLAWSPAGASLAAASRGHGVLVWDVAEPGREPRHLGDERDVFSVAWSHDGRRLAAGTAAGHILLWEPPKVGAVPIRLLGHTARVEALRFHPRRDLLVSGSLDRSLRIWDVNHPRGLPLVLHGHDYWVWSAAFSPDGEYLISGSGDRTIHLWPTSTAALAAEVCQTVTRDLTREEWQEHLPAEVDYEPLCPGLGGAGKS